MEVIICENEQNWCDNLSAQIGRWAAKTNTRVNYTTFRSPDNLIAHISMCTKYDVFFLDIALGGDALDGLTLARHIRKAGIETPIIFFTVHPHYAVDGYTVGAFGYLLKPVNYNRLSLYMNRILKTQRGSKNVTISNGSTMTKIYYNDILFIESKNHKIIYHTVSNDSIEVRGTLSDVVAALGDGLFVQIHKSYIIPVSNIVGIRTKYPYSVQVKTGDKLTDISVGRKYLSPLINAYTNETLEEML